MTDLTVHSAGLAVTIQDMGRIGTLRLGLSRGGAMDRMALLEGAALLNQGTPKAALEMAGTGGEYSVSAPTRIALTGAPMQCKIDGVTAAWNTSHLLVSGARLTIGSASKGTYGYVSFAGGITTNEMLNSRSAHLTSGIGSLICDGEMVPLGPDKNLAEGSLTFSPSDRFSGGVIRVLPGPQTSLYSSQTIDIFANTEFQRSSHANRQGIRVDHDGAPFKAPSQLGIVSDLIMPGDIQMTGEGIPFVLMPECQTIGGYPRIGTVLPMDLTRIAQAAPGTPLRFEFVTFEQADKINLPDAQILRNLRGSVKPLIRNPHDIPDLLSYQLIDGAISGDDMERP